MIPFNRPAVLGTEVAAISRALNENYHASGGGPFTRTAEKTLEQMLGQQAILVSSCTHALEVSALLLRLQPGDEVIIPSFTFVSTANAFALHGARPLFADVDAYGNILISEVERLMTKRVRAVVPVHYGGSSCDMTALAAACGSLPIIEDAAQSLGAFFDGRPLGTLGAMASFSFHETKNLGCGEGGAFTTHDREYLERAEILRDKGTNRKQFLNGLVDKYTWVDVGSSYVLSEVNAAYLSAQLDGREMIQARRKVIHERYAKELGADIEKAGAYAIGTPPRCTPNHHLFAIVFRLPEQRQKFIAHMREKGILTPFHYAALHQSPMGKRFHDDRPLPGTERLSQCLVRLPLFFNLSDAEQEEVIARALEYLRKP